MNLKKEKRCLRHRFFIFAFILFKKDEGIENNSAVFADKINSKGLGKFCNFDAITAYGMDCGIRMAARFAGFDSTFFAKVAAAGCKNSGIFAVEADFLHGFPKELASALVGDLLAKIAFLAGKINILIFLGENKAVFKVMELCNKGCCVANCGRAHIAGMIHSAKVLFAETAKGRVARNKSCGDLFTFFETDGFGNFFNFLVHQKSASFREYSNVSI